MLDTAFLGGDGGTTVDTSTAAPDAATPVVTDPAASESAPLADQATPATLPTGEDPSPIDAILQPPTGQPEPAAEPTEEETEAQLQAALADPATPQWARKKIEEAMGYAGKLKSTRDEYKTQLDDLTGRFGNFEGKQPIPTTDLERMTANEAKLLGLQSFTATPDEIDTQLRELVNPRTFESYQQSLVLKAMEREDGTPDLDNVQVLIDRMTGYNGEGERVSAKDALAAINAMKAGELTPEDFQKFSSPEQAAEWERQRALTKQQEADQQRADQTARYYESQVRAQELQNIVYSMQNEVQAPVIKHLEDFKLMPVAGEPKVAADFKADVLAKVGSLISNAQADIPELGQLEKAMKALGEAQGYDPQKAVAEIKAFQSSQAYQQYLSKGVSDLISKVEKVITAEALRYKYMMAGYAQELAKPNGARPVIGAPNASTNLTNLSEEDIKKLQGAEKNDAVAQIVSQGFRQLQNPQNASIG